MYTMTNKAQILLDSEHTWGRGFTLLEGTWDGDPALGLWLGDMGLYFSGAHPHCLTQGVNTVFHRGDPRGDKNSSM